MKKPRFALALASTAVVATLGAAVALADDTETPLKTAVNEVRTAGVALFEWYQDSDRALPPFDGGEEVTSVDVAAATPLDAAAARQRALPAVAVERLDRLDPWGHAYEIRLGNGTNAPTLVVRSAGPNGRFEGTRYGVGPFHEGDSADDVVWADGYFLRWPVRR